MTFFINLWPKSKFYGFSKFYDTWEAIFSNSDDQHHKPTNFEMTALDSSHKLHGFCI